jgi:hypothetical protein
MAQTPQQRRSNEKFAKAEASKRGKADGFVKTKEKTKPPISTGWIVALAFVVMGGLIFELMRLIFT